MDSSGVTGAWLGLRGSKPVRRRYSPAFVFPAIDLRSW